MNLKNGLLAIVVFACPVASMADGIDTKAVIGGGLGGALGAALALLLLALYRWARQGPGGGA